ncbi:copper-translocating P-type ATPase [Cytobacillus sp. IB215665]|uniref:copper-translocating P-type ATPase n=1 Tax=Cytobacillus sp. IB215665 TaxID=3097357 RepID=UPI002A130A3D|nr:copper-translocating P-type ATPase [Cytobacillus sp. IB215665]MDX8366695.1 copper-translocating P-type ATPase [Cytobacillus sp. IB215665]
MMKGKKTHQNVGNPERHTHQEHDDHKQHGHVGHNHLEHNSHNHNEHDGHKHREHNSHNHNEHDGRKHREHNSHNHNEHDGHKHREHNSHNHNEHDGRNHQEHSSHNHNEHGGHNHQGHGGHNHGHMIAEFKRRFYISLIVTIPILIFSPMIQSILGYELSFYGVNYALFILATFIFFYGGKPFLTGSYDELKQKSPGMMTLIALAIVVAYIYSTLTVFGLSGNNFFWELATLIDIMLLGHWIEMRSVMGASKALEELAKMIPSEAHLIDENGEITDVNISHLTQGNKVLVKPGEKVPVDGTIIKGNSSINESMLTGESVPVEKTIDDGVIAGSINGEGSLTIQVEKTGEDSYLSQVVKMVKEAQESRSKTQDLANRAAKWLFYLALIAGFVTLVTWLLLGYPFVYALERMVTVMVIACPHALGLAAPLVVARSTALAAKQGLLIRNRANFEEARNIQSIVFDKTGTLTEGEFGVTDIMTENGYEKKDVLQLAASLEVLSEHPIAKGIVGEAKAQKLTFYQPDEFESMTGKGLKGIVKGKEILLVSPGFVKANNIRFQQETFERLSEQGKTVIFVLINSEVAGMIALADKVRESAERAIARLKNINVQSLMLTGDNYKVAQWVGKQLNLDDVVAEVLPHEKADKIKELKANGLKIAMTGDGVNDAPALANADLGIAVGAGTDVAMETADVILVKSNPEDVVSILELSKSTYRKMIQNLWWATGYNIVAIPLAAGILSPIGIVLSPAVGAVLMSLSTVIVAINARLFKG